MGKMKECYMDILEYAENCCGFSDSKLEAQMKFEALYPEDDAIFGQAWDEWLMFSAHLIALECLDCFED